MISKKLYLFMILNFVGSVLMQATQQVLTSEILVTYQPMLDLFHELLTQNKSVQISMMPRFFLQLGMSYKPMIKQLHKDIDVVSKEIKKLKRNKNLYTTEFELKKQLSDLYKYLKKHRLQYEVALVHQAMHDRWDQLFDTVAQGQDISLLLPLPTVSEAGLDGLKILVKQVESDLKKIENYEYRLHTDWIDAKLANYVLKIELIRLRNAVLFHPLYKHTSLKLSSNYPR